MFPHTPNARKRMVSALDSSFDQQRGTTDCCTRLSKRRQISSPFISQHGCVVCLETGLQLVQLGTCGHAVCRSCMASALLHAFKLQHLPLRCPMPHCKAQLQLQPAVQLLEQQVPGSSALAAKVLVSAASDLALIPHHLRCPCPYTDCQVPLEFPDEPLQDVPLDCPSCQRAVCSTCRSKWHIGLTCCQNQSRSKPSCDSKQRQDQQQQQDQQQGRDAAQLGGHMSGRWQQQHEVAASAAHSTLLVQEQQQQQYAQRQAQWHHACSSLRTYEGYGQSLASSRQQQQHQQAPVLVHQQQQPGDDQDAMVWSPVKGATGAH